MPPPLSGGDACSVGDAAVFGVLTVSDRASAGVYEDLSGPAILQFFAEAVASPWAAKYVVVPDEQPLIEAAIKDLVRRRACCEAAAVMPACMCGCGCCGSGGGGAGRAA